VVSRRSSGGCQCGAVRFSISGKLGSSGICHCRMCQKASGNWGMALVSVPENNLEWTRGKPGEFRSSSVVSRGFCASCGTPLYMKEDGDPVYEIAVGALDNPGIAPPTRQSGIESKLSWFSTLHTLPGEFTAKTRTAEEMSRLTSLQHPDHDTDRWPPE